MNNYFVEYINNFFVEYINNFFVECVNNYFVEYIDNYFLEYINNLLNQKNYRVERITLFSLNYPFLFLHFSTLNTMQTIQARRNEKSSGGGLGVCEKMLPNLVRWLGRKFD